MEYYNPFNKLTSKIFIGFVLSVAIGFFGCSQGETLYQIEIRNELPVMAVVSLDGSQEKEVNTGGTATFYDVEAGTHILRAEASGFEPIEEFVRVERDVIWTIQENGR